MKDSERLQLDNQLCFALYSTSLAMTQLYKRYLSPLGITYTQYTILLILWEQDDVSLKFVADRLGQKSGSLTPVIKRMEQEGLIQRIRGLNDDRALSIRLTDKGQAMREQAAEINQCLLDACGMPLDDLAALREQVLSLRNKLIE